MAERGIDTFSAEVDELVMEAQELRHEHEEKWRRNERRYLGDHWDRPALAGLDQHTINRILTTILAHTAVQTEQRASVKFSPHEIGEPPIVYMKPDILSKLPETSQAPSFTPLQLAGQEPIEDFQFFALLAVTRPELVEVPTVDAQGNETIEEQPQDVPVFTDDDFHIVNENMIAEAMQSLFDAKWEQADADHWWTQNVLYKNVYGHQAMLVEWDDEKQCYSLCNVRPDAIWISPDATDVADTDYLIYDQFISAKRATDMMPQYADVIAAEATRTPITDRHNKKRNVSNYQRDMVNIRHVWMRNFRFPMEVDEALERELVAPAVTEQEGIDENGNAFVQELPVLDDEGQQVYQTANGELSSPGDEAWPTQSHLIEGLIIGHTTVEQRRSPFVDIPFAWNVSIPLPHQPYGMGTPEHLEDLQQAANRAMTYTINTLRYNQSPEKAMPASVLKALDDKATSLHSHPGRVIGVPDALWAQYGGKILDTWEPNNIQTGVVQFFQVLLQEIDRQGGNPDVLQGNAPGRADSGRAIEALQAAARGTLGFQSLFTEHAIKQMAKLVVGMFIDFMEESEWERVLRKYPVQVLRAIRTRAMNQPNVISVEIASGRGAVKRQKEDQAIQLRQLGALSLATTLERVGIPDPEEEAQRTIQEFGAAAPAS